MKNLKFTFFLIFGILVLMSFTWPSKKIKSTKDYNCSYVLLIPDSLRDKEMEITGYRFTGGITRTRVNRLLSRMVVNSESPVLLNETFLDSIALSVCGDKKYQLKELEVYRRASTDFGIILHFDFAKREKK